MLARSLIASLIAAIYALLSALHVYWALGGKWGSVGTIPELRGEPTFQPSRAATWLVAAALAAAALLVAFSGGLLRWPLPAVPLGPAMYLLGGVFALRALGDFRLVGFFKRVRGTRFAQLDSYVFSPLCTALSAGVLWLALC